MMNSEGLASPPQGKLSPAFTKGVGGDVFLLNRGFGFGGFYPVATTGTYLKFIM